MTISSVEHSSSVGDHVVIVGGQWGDEGKGKLVDKLAGGADVVVRFSGANNAGHTLEVPQGKFIAHYLPSGIAQGKICVLAHGVLMNLRALLDEIEDAKKTLGELPTIYIDAGSPIHTDFHQLMEIWMERIRARNSGSTGKAVAQMQALYDLRISLVVSDVFLTRSELIAKLKDLYEPIKPMLEAARDRGFLEEAKVIIPSIEEVADDLRELGNRAVQYVADTRVLLLKWHKEGKKILFEGAQATLLDPDWGTYNAISSGKSTSLGIPQCTGLPLGVFKNTSVIIAVKPFSTRVGKGPMANEIGSRSGAEQFAKQYPYLFNPNSEERAVWLERMLKDINAGTVSDQDFAHYLESLGMEKGATTARGRSPGYPDPVMTRYTVEINGATGIAMMRLDMCSGLLRIPMVVSYNRDGQEISNETICMYNYRDLRPNLAMFQGWETDISGYTEWDQLPAAARRFVEHYEKIAGAPIKYIGTGPGRDAIIVR